MINEKIKISTKNLNVFYASKQALFDININLKENKVTALIGPSGCGKSTFIRCLNRMNDVIDICKVEGSIKIDGDEINKKNLDVNQTHGHGFSKAKSVSNVDLRKRGLSAP